jgi:methionyl aminopeptidase
MMRRAGRIAAAARALAGDMATVGVTTKQIDTAVHDFIISQGAIPTFLNYNGFPASICASVNDQIIHGIPNDRTLRDGDIVSIDVGATKDGYVGDCAATFLVGQGTEEKRRLIEVTKQSFFEGIKYAREGYRISDVSHAIQHYVEQNGFSVVREYVGHGIGSMMHEPPEVPNFGSPGHGVRIIRGMTLAIEPMVNAGGSAIRLLSDNWTVKTDDGSLSAHYENTILVTDGEPEILTVTGGR